MPITDVVTGTDMTIKRPPRSHWHRGGTIISGDWGKFFGQRLGAARGRGELSRDMLIDLLKRQNYRCALSGVPLTCLLQKGAVTKTNASIDRINPKGGYVLENVQLVCAAINKFRVDLPVNEFVSWCRKVADYAV